MLLPFCFNELMCVYSSYQLFHVSVSRNENQTLPKPVFRLQPHTPSTTSPVRLILDIWIYRYQQSTPLSATPPVIPIIHTWTFQPQQPTPPLTHWGRVTHICVSKLTIIGSDNGLSPGRRQAIIWTNAGILLIRTLATNFSEILGKIHSFSFSEIHLKMSSAKWRLFGLDLNELTAPLMKAIMNITTFHLQHPGMKQQLWARWSRRVCMRQSQQILHCQGTIYSPLEETRYKDSHAKDKVVARPFYL